MPLAFEGGRIVIRDGKLGHHPGCCCPDEAGDCETCCQCWNVSASIGTEFGSVEVVGTPDVDNCICTFEPFSIPMTTVGLRSSTIRVVFLKITATKAVIGLNYNDVDCCAGANDEDSWYVEDEVDNTNCDGSISFTVEFPTVGVATITFSACTPCPGNDPKMICSVSGSSGTVNWVGESWVLPEDSDQPKSVCPDKWFIGKSYSVTYGHWVAENVWSFGGVGFPNGELYLQRRYRASFYNGYYYLVNIFGSTVRNVLEAYAAYSEFQFYGKQPARPVTPTFTNTFQAGTPFLNKINGVAAPTYSNYALTDEFFGTYTKAGITYKWEKGLDW